jgi:expansin (peptidoglycan-binding protein)
MEWEVLSVLRHCEDVKLETFADLKWLQFRHIDNANNNHFVTVSISPLGLLTQNPFA